MVVGNIADTTPQTSDRATRLLAAARELINETGNFEFTMRALASRAVVSLREPYQIFGSKVGIVRALLKGDQANLVSRTKILPDANEHPIEFLFARLHTGTQFCEENEPFYRALFRATQGYSGGVETEPAQENLQWICAVLRKAVAAGVISKDVDVVLLAQTRTDVLASNLRVWAASDADIYLYYLKCGFGVSQTLIGATEPKHVADMIARRSDYQGRIQNFVPGTGFPPLKIFDGRVSDTPRRDAAV